jgi:YbbR domain-containing protein
MKRLLQIAAAFAIRKNFFAKTICLALAVVLWALVSSSKIETLKFKIPIQYKNLPQELMVSNISDKFATLIFEGKSDDLKNPLLKNVKAVVNLEYAAAGEARAYPLEIEKQDIPDDILVSSAQNEVMVTVDTKEEKWVEVIPSLAGSAPPGKVIIDRSVAPERVKIAGPSSQIDEIQSVETQDVPVAEGASDFERRVGLKKDDKFKYITFGERNFTVKVTLADLKDISAVRAPVKLRGAVRGYGYEIKNTAVEVYVRLRENRTLTPDDIDAFVDAAELNLNKIFENEKMTAAWRELPIIVVGRDSITADIVSYMPKRAWVKISRKRNQ